MSYIYLFAVVLYDCTKGMKDLELENWIVILLLLYTLNPPRSLSTWILLVCFFFSPEAKFLHKNNVEWSSRCRIQHVALSSVLTSRRTALPLVWCFKYAALLPRPIDLNLWTPTSNWVPVHHEWQSGACDWCEVTVTLGSKNRSARLCVWLNSGVYWRLKAAEIWRMGAVWSDSLWFIYNFWVCF